MNLYLPRTYRKPPLTTNCLAILLSFAVLNLTLTSYQAAAEPNHTEAKPTLEETIQVEIIIPPAEANSAADQNKTNNTDKESEAQEAEHMRHRIHDAHEAIESEDAQASFLKRWWQNFNYPRMLHNAYRWYLLNIGDEKAKDHAANIAAMLLVSHTVETLGGGAVAAANQKVLFDGTQGVSTRIWALVFSIAGIAISTPGFDPICIGLIAAYRKWPVEMNKALQRPRVILVRAVNGAAMALSLPALMHLFLQRQDGLEFLAKAILKAPEGRYLWQFSSKGLSFDIYAQDGTRAITLQVERSSTKEPFAVAAASFNPAKLTPQMRAELQNLLKPFGTNAMQGVMDSFDYLVQKRGEDLGKFFYVSKVEDASDGEFIVHYRTPALAILNGWKPRVGWCAWLWGKTKELVRTE